ncbi:MAG: EAL domain-containing protein [Actinomycetia bacterium]|nr:EAL domain-containing protein [Actinomycetes bacterium]
MSDASRDMYSDREAGDLDADNSSGRTLDVGAAGGYEGAGDRDEMSSPRWLVTRTVVVVILGLLVTAVIVGLAINAERQQREATVAVEVQETKRQIEQRIAELDTVLLGLRGSVVSNLDFDAEAFHKAVNGSAALENVAPVRAVQWAVTVPLDGGKAFEKQTKVDVASVNDHHAAGVAEHEVPAAIEIHPPLDKPNNYVIKYVEPAKNNSQAFGLNLSALPGRQEVANRARDTGEQVRSGPFELVLQNDEKALGFVAYLPVYSTSTVPTTVAQRRALFEGLIIGVFEFDKVFQNLGVADFKVYDSTTPANGADSGEDTRLDPGEFLRAEPGEVIFETSPNLDEAEAAQVWTAYQGGRTWTVAQFESEQSALSTAAILLVTLLGLAGLALTGLVGAFVWSSGRHRMESERDLAIITASRKRFHELSMADPLTGIANRRSLMRDLGILTEVAQRQREKLLLLFLDVDSFKDINDQHGHKEGDALLVEVAARLQRVARESDLIGRLAGDEFCVAGLVDDRAAAERMADRVLAELATPFQIAGSSLEVDVSVGALLVSGGSRAASEMLDAADLAMYQAKDQPSSAVVWFDDELEQRKQDELQMLRWLDEAIEQGAFQMVYQPVVNVTTRQVEGLEALLRLTPLEGGSVISPDRFIELAERSRRILPLGRAAIERTLSELAEWRSVNPDSDLQVGINLSAAQVCDSQTLDVLMTGIARHQLPPDLVVLELTETAFVSDVAAAGEFIRKAKNRGMRLAVDDYGVGYSNMQRLSSIEFDVLKIDRSLTAQMEESERIREIVRGMSQLARSLGATSVCEGVETATQARTVQELGLDYIQGYLVSRPVPSIAAATSATMPQI